MSHDVNTCALPCKHLSLCSRQYTPGSNSNTPGLFYFLAENDLLDCLVTSLSFKSVNFHLLNKINALKTN